MGWFDWIVNAIPRMRRKRLAPGKNDDKVIALIEKIYDDTFAASQIDAYINTGNFKEGPYTEEEMQTIVNNGAAKQIAQTMCAISVAKDTSMQTWRRLFDSITTLQNVGEYIHAFDYMIKQTRQVHKQNIVNVHELNAYSMKVNILKENERRNYDTIFDKIRGITQTLGESPRHSFEIVDYKAKTSGPVIELIELMNGQQNYAVQAKMYMAFKQGRIPVTQVPNGPYTYSQLEKMLITEESREAVDLMFNLEQNREKARNTELSIVNVPEAAKQEQKQALAGLQAQTSIEVAKHRNSLSGITSIEDYIQRIADLVAKELSLQNKYKGECVRIGNQSLIQQTKVNAVKPDLQIIQ